MHVRMRRRILLGLGVAVTTAAGLAAVPATASASGASPVVRQINLVSDQPGMAQLTDPYLVNAWGMSHGPGTPIWVSDNGADVSTLYRGAVGGTAVSVVPLTVWTPGGAPTGQVFNDTTGFTVPGTTSPALFVFAGENGDLSAWNQAVSPITNAVAIGHVTDAVFKGLALVHSPFGPLLLASDFHHNEIDVWDSTFTQLPVGKLFHDSSLPAGYAPFNIAEVGKRVFVTYAKQDAAKHDDVAGPGNGFIDVYTNYGALLTRFVNRGMLDSPWGMAVAPMTFGALGGDLLVGNFGDGRINAFNRNTGHLDGTLQDAHHNAIQIDGLWGLMVGDSAAGGTSAVWFSAGPNDESHGLLGILRAG